MISIIIYCAPWESENVSPFFFLTLLSAVCAESCQCLKTSYVFDWILAINQLSFGVKQQLFCGSGFPKTKAPWVSKEICNKVVTSTQTRSLRRLAWLYGTSKRAPQLRTFTIHWLLASMCSGLVANISRCHVNTSGLVSTQQSGIFRVQ